MKEDHIETSKFLKECLVKVNNLRNLNSNKKKTLKQKAYSSLFQILESRISAKVAICNAAINDDSVSIAGKQIQEMLYGDLISFLEKELNET